MTFSIKKLKISKRPTLKLIFEFLYEAQFFVICAGFIAIELKILVIPVYVFSEWMCF